MDGISFCFCSVGGVCVFNIGVDEIVVLIVWIEDVGDDEDVMLSVLEIE